jgi:tRNA1Val (adenine37-N6)-methyltransferase
MKSKTHFHFKQFSLQHDRCAMKVGTDSVLLGCWANVKRAKNILDIGTGSGVIALMMAQRTSRDTQIDAVEISTQDAGQALENILQSPWPGKIAIENISIQDFFPNRCYDIIISNPPYFNNSEEPPDSRRLQTRHTITLTYETLILSVRRLLRNDGRFNIILPYAEGNQFIRLAEEHEFYCTRKYGFRTRAEKPIERWLLEFSYDEQPPEAGEVLHYAKGLAWSDQYISLTRDFYLKL